MPDGVDPGEQVQSQRESVKDLIKGPNTGKARLCLVDVACGQMERRVRPAE